MFSPGERVQVTTADGWTSKATFLAYHPEHPYPCYVRADRKYSSPAFPGCAEHLVSFREEDLTSLANQSS